MTREMDRSVRYSCQIFSGFNIPKLLKLVNFWQSYSKNRKVDVLGTGYIFICIGIKLKDVILIFKTKSKNKFAASVPETKYHYRMMYVNECYFA